MEPKTPASPPTGPTDFERLRAESVLSATSKRTVVLLCTYNEASNLPGLFAQLNEHLPTADILVVDDNSPDGTSAMVSAQSNFAVEQATGKHGTEGVDAPDASIFLLARQSKLGLGSATRDGLKWCLGQQYDLILNMDADLSHEPQFAPQLVEACQSPHDPADVAIGSRYVDGGGWDGLAWHRRWISRLLNSYATRALRLPIKDCSGSFRCYRADALRRLDWDELTCSGYGFLEEILVALHRRGSRLKEFPIRFQMRAGGKSKLGLSDALGAMRTINRLALER